MANQIEQTLWIAETGEVGNSGIMLVDTSRWGIRDWATFESACKRKVVDLWGVAQYLTNSKSSDSDSIGISRDTLSSEIGVE